MLIYGNVAFSRGIDTFYRDFKEASANSILLPDTPVRESEPFVSAAEQAGIAPIVIAPARASRETLEGLAHTQRAKSMRSRATVSPVQNGSQIRPVLVMS